MKILLVLGLTLAILVPLTLVRGVIHERKAYRAQAVAEVAASHGGAQRLAGPVLVVPYTDRVEAVEIDARGIERCVVREQAGRWTFFPKRMDVDGRLKAGERKRGLYPVRVYEWNARTNARFDVELPASPLAGTTTRRIGTPVLVVGVSDVRGVVGTPTLRVDGRALAVREGLGAFKGAGLHATLPVPAPGARIAFDAVLDLTLAGTESLRVVPVAQDNDIALAGNWPHPKFSGTLPRTRRVSDAGFEARWQVASLATRAQAQYAEAMDTEGEGANLDAVQVELIDPVDIYTLADRATKYGLLFVLLTFVGFFLFELIRALPIHPIQYALVGLALAIFFLLLVSLSEHVSFGIAYLVASVACIGLIGFYLSAVLRSPLRAAGFTAMLATLYGALYGLLVSEDNALVLGAGLLFVVLAAVMAVTRKVDWYAMSLPRAA